MAIKEFKEILGRVWKRSSSPRVFYTYIYIYISYCVLIDVSYLCSLCSSVSHSNVLCLVITGKVVNVEPLENLMAKKDL